MLRRLATSLAATSALVLTATAPAFADHEVPDTRDDGPGGNLTCSEIDLEPLGAKVDNPDLGDFENDFFTATVTEVDGVENLKVVAKDGYVIDAVLVKGTNATNVFDEPPFEHMFAPDAASDKPAAISHYDVCGRDADGDDGDNGDDGDDKETPKPETTETPEPKTTETPAAVPTAVPAGASGSNDASMAPVGIAAAALMVMAGGAALLRRRFAHQS